MALCLTTSPDLVVASTATFVDGVYGCATGTHLLLTPSETNALNVFHAGPEHYESVTVLFGVVLAAACVVWGVKQVLRLLRNPSEF